VPDGEPTPLTFDDRTEVTIPAGGQVFSDPLTLAVPAQVNLLVSLYLPKPLRAAPVHHAALVANYITPAGAGDRTGDLNAASFTRRFYSWTLLSGVDVIPATRAGSVVFIGDSITDGVGAVVGAHRSWPEYVAARLLREPAAPGVLDAGISGNKVLADEYPGSGVVGRSAGTSAASRLQRDVLGQTGVRTVVVLEGINDLKGGAPAGQVIAGLKWIAAEARAYGLRVIAGTITPFQGWRTYTSWREANRQAVNAFIRNSGGVFDGHIDFDRAVRDPHNPHRLRPRYDSGDHLHPGGNGYRAMAYTVPLSALRPGESRS
jgi:lysophospholipase L1-like esterase